MIGSAQRGGLRPVEAQRAPRSPVLGETLARASESAGAPIRFRCNAGRVQVVHPYRLADAYRCRRTQRKEDRGEDGGDGSLPQEHRRTGVRIQVVPKTSRHLPNPRKQAEFGLAIRRSVCEGRPELITGPRAVNAGPLAIGSVGTRPTARGTLSLSPPSNTGRNPNGKGRRAMSDPDQTVIATTVAWLRLAAGCEDLHPRMRAPLLTVAETLEGTLPPAPATPNEGH